MSLPRYRVATPPTGKPLLLWDGECGFCRLWAERWREEYGTHVDLATAQSQSARFPEIPATAYDQGIQLVETDGHVYSGVAAALRTRLHGTGGRWWWRAYESIPGLATALDAGYRVVARHRPVFSRLTRVLVGPNLQRPNFSASTAIFLRALAAIYFIAFASLWWQLNGLIGPDGILPAQPYLDAVGRQLGLLRFWYLPTLSWFFGAGSFLHLLCAGGLLLAGALWLRLAQPLCLLLLWLFYLSLCSAGQVFLGYQWDGLLLETGLLAIFVAPWRSLAGRTEPPKLARWLLWWLLFRLMFMSGYVKLASGDVTWHNLTALIYHYQTQPLPTWVAWHVYQLPAWFHRLSCLAMFVIEFAAPFLLFGPRRLRLVAALNLISLQVLIMLTGNYTFFNLLTCSLCLLFLDDAWWSRWFGIAPRRYADVVADRSEGRHNPLPGWLRRSVFTGFLGASLIVTLPGLLSARSWPAWYVTTYRGIAVTRSVNSYGLFAVMTTHRPEIVVEGSRDGRTW